MTSLCHICTARSLHCITFKITEILFTCDCKSSFLKFIPWMLLIPSTYLYMWGSYLTLEKASTHYVRWSLLLSWHPQLKTELQNSLCLTTPPTFPSIGIPVVYMPFSLFPPGQAAMEIMPPYCSVSAFSIWKKSRSLPCPQKLDQLWLWQKCDGNQVREVWGIHEHKDAAISK